jgi:predicted nucleic acid-binding protein
MMVLVDTSIWSLALRRVSGALSSQQQKHVHALRELLSEGRVQLLGAVRQELLSGIRHKEQLVRLRDYLRSFPDLALVAEDYETAAGMNNTFRALGVSGSPTDLLICSAASRRGSAIFTSDRDFETYAKHLPIKLYH